MNGTLFSHKVRYVMITITPLIVVVRWANFKCPRVMSAISTPPPASSDRDTPTLLSNTCPEII